LKIFTLTLETGCGFNLNFSIPQ